MAITTMNDVVAGLNNQQLYNWYKTSYTTKGLGYLHSLWKVSGNPLSAATPPSGAGEVPTKDTVGAIPFTNPGGGNTLYLGRASFTSLTAGTFILYDRLVHTSGLVGNTTSPQTVNSTALTRYTTGEGCLLFMEMYTGTGTGTPTVTATYTNQANVGSKSATLVLTASPVAGQLHQFQLAEGDTGVRSVETITNSVGTGSAGNFGIVIAKPLTSFMISTASQGLMLDAIALGMPQVASNACLSMMLLASATSHALNLGQFSLMEG